MAGTVLPPCSLAWGGPVLDFAVTIEDYTLYGTGNGNRLPGLLLPVPLARDKPLSTHTSTGDSQTLTGKSGSVSCGVTVPFSWVLVHTGFCLCLPGVSVSQSCGSSVIKSHSKSFKLGFNSTRTENFQMYKLDLERAEEPNYWTTRKRPLQRFFFLNIGKGDGRVPGAMPLSKRESFKFIFFIESLWKSEVEKSMALISIELGSCIGHPLYPIQNHCCKCVRQNPQKGFQK